MNTDMHSCNLMELLSAVLKWWCTELLCVILFLLQTTGRLVDLPRAVYTVDYDRRSQHPVIAAGTSNFVYLVKRT